MREKIFLSSALGTTHPITVQIHDTNYIIEIKKIDNTEDNTEKETYYITLTIREKINQALSTTNDKKLYSNYANIILNYIVSSKTCNQLKTPSIRYIRPTETDTEGEKIEFTYQLQKQKNESPIEEEINKLLAPFILLLKEELV